jgi:hypothetical protein
MKRIEVKLALPVVAPLLDVVRELADGLGRAPAGLAQPPDQDPEFKAAWVDELVRGQAEEVKTLLALFGDEFFADGVVAFDEENAEPVVRACAAVRLRLRELFLNSLGDDLLETGDVEPSRLEEPVRRAFFCYLFLATVQELVIQHLDGGILGN